MIVHKRTTNKPNRALNIIHDTVNPNMNKKFTNDKEQRQSITFIKREKEKKKKIG